MCALELTACQAALIPFEVVLTVTPRTESLDRGRTSWTDGVDKTFDGALVAPSVFAQLIAPGGMDSSTDQLLVVGADLRDSKDSALTISKGDWITDAAGVKFRVLKLTNTTGLFDLLIYELAEERTGT